MDTYEKKLALAKEALDSGSYDKETVEYIFPELFKSEDEKIRKFLIQMAQNGHGGDKDWWNKCVAWLEKQDGSLLSWSKADEEMFRLLEGIVKDYWAKAEQEKNEIKIREASNASYFLKTIQKSPLCWIKCSDGLPNRDGIYLVVTDGLYNEVYDMARYDSIEGWHKASEIIYWMPIPQLNDKSIIKQKNPANYAKTCKDGQKPWGEEDEKFVHGLIRGLAAKRDIHGHTTFSSDCIDITETINWLKSLRPLVRWKPSDEHIHWLKWAINRMPDTEKANEAEAVLEELLEQLKKLK